MSLVLAAAVVVAVGALVPGWLETVARLGQNIPQDDIRADYSKGVFWAVFVTCLLIFAPIPRSHKSAVLSIWLVKVFIALVVMLPFEDNYALLDQYRWWLAGSQGHLSLDTLGIGTSPEGGSQIVTLVAWIHARLGIDSYHATKVTFSLFGLVAVYLFYRAAARFLGRDRVAVLYIVGFFPSVAFWSTILGKDPLILLAIALYTYGTVSWYVTGSGRWVGLIAAGLLLALLMRAWLGIIFVPPLLLLVFNPRSALVTRLALSVVVLVTLGLTFVGVTHRFGISSANDIITTTSTVSQSFAVGGSNQDFAAAGIDLSDIRGLLEFAPLGAFTALFRPLPGEVPNFFGLAAGLENVLLLLLLARCLRWRCALRLREPMVIWAISVIVSWAFVYGFASYQNLGTAVRFRLQILPILLAVLLYLPSEINVPRRWRSRVGDREQREQEVTIQLGVVAR